MTLVSYITKQTTIGDRKLIIGYFTNTGTGGDITTGLQVVETLIIQHTGSAAINEAPSVYETLPLSGLSAATIVTTNAKAGIFIAIGY